MSSWEEHRNIAQVSFAWCSAVKNTYQTTSTSFSITFTVPKRGHCTTTPREGTAVQGDTHDSEVGGKEVISVLETQAGVSASDGLRRVPQLDITRC
jgi:hypothetical protein